jgi:murein DD-endopeptidase MepM/ murein hydrolase activator NlpD
LKKVKYFYSTKTQRFEPLRIPLWKKILRVFGLLSAILVTAGFIVALAFRYLQSPNEKRMNSELNNLQEKYALLKDDLMEAQEKLSELEQRDNEVYRVIFEADPVTIPQRSGQVLFDEKAMAKKLLPFSNQELIENLDRSLQALSNRLVSQEKSYKTIQTFIENKQEMLACIPSIQPISNKQLNRIASGFGYRIDPIYKIGKFHAGLDFTAPAGTPIYATGNGVISLAEYNPSGYGNHVWIDHGYGYKTHYAHLVRIKAKAQQQVTRGEVIGWVGSTGKSTGPHCHYEVEKNGIKIDPIHFFYNDLDATQYETMVQLAATGNQSFD